ncbi:hypothetical protein GOBAR_AA39362 [Gossypium barbadense]|uniref:Uncharacterized protein n=1 Tax=Gossypium barbadense TaxID=3634 RepID=A0A2P5VR76_GOSBA|nr:hypothetical protein GOBAR_AA39362 [Gossypium barbadense]
MTVCRVSVFVLVGVLFLCGCIDGRKLVSEKEVHAVEKGIIRTFLFSGLMMRRVGSQHISADDRPDFGVTTEKFDTKEKREGKTGLEFNVKGQVDFNGTKIIVMVTTVGTSPKSE